jgi:glycosyltransferase involved in cell wall biosynthesis
MRIAFIHPHKAFLPEIDAYRKFFSGFNIETIVAKPDQINKLDADVEWHLMGTDKKKNGVIKIHEYTSASVPPFNKLKNFSKKIFNTIPDYRLFLNNYVLDKLGFHDEVPFGFRDMGVADSFLSFDNSSIKKEFDFVYAGSLSPERKIEELIKCFATNDLQGHSLLIISKDYDEMMARFKNLSNIHFLGPIRHAEMPSYISRARFAINLIIDVEPFNRQTSTKLIEYAALKVPVITTDYKWIRDFEKENGGSFFYLEKDLSNFQWRKISGFDYSFPALEEWAWEKQIRKSGVLGFLKTKFPELSFHF